MIATRRSRSARCAAAPGLADACTVGEVLAVRMRVVVALDESRSEREEVERARREAGDIGGRRPENEDEALRAAMEAGGGEAEGFEQAESLLISHSTHEDQHAARRVIQDAPAAEAEDPQGQADSGEADGERSTERSSD
jgi:hypothetical protein